MTGTGVDPYLLLHDEELAMAEGVLRAELARHMARGGDCPGCQTEAPCDLGVRLAAWLRHVAPMLSGNNDG